ncbi:TniB family NTP-binding protein [Butyrivibrio sp. AC2005]|uniref:TniB family NTP-binding protein n=1 Tax=Butyrivibrio sp. AC2005 TaxID=1280672 RepID=UPI0004264098|nr:TniB family NTP-binding protein [Butyrivibrio sp. AC2005]
MTNIDYVSLLPHFLSKDLLLDALTVFPDYDDSVREENTVNRLMRLSDIYSLYLPSPMTLEIYNKLYLATVMSLQKKNSRVVIHQQNQTYKSIYSGDYHGIIGGADSFSIVGMSGIGKSSAIQRSISLITGGNIICTESPYTKVIPCLLVQCPFDCSSKGLLLEILMRVDEVLGTSYYEKSVRSASTTDRLIGTVSNVALNHIGLLIIDEIQNVAGHKSGNSLLAMLTQLINSSGISICFVGTPESIPFFERAFQMARRAQGLRYSRLEYGDFFKMFCRLASRYQYVKNYSEISDGMVEYLYEHSGGIMSVVMSLLHDAQEIAICDGYELLDMKAMDKAYKKRLMLLHGFIEPSIKQIHAVKKRKSKVPREMVNENLFGSEYLTITEIAEMSKNQGLDVVDILNDYIVVEEV